MFGFMERLELMIQNMVEAASLIAEFLASIINELKQGNIGILAETISDFVRSVIFAFMNWKNFSGRASRSEYWYFWIFTTFSPYLILHIHSYVVTDFHSQIHADHQHVMMGLLTVSALILLFGIFYIITAYSLAVRRMHDINLGSTAVLYGLVPFHVTWFALLLTKGTKGSNNYGPDPLAYLDY